MELTECSKAYSAFAIDINVETTNPTYLINLIEVSGLKINSK